MDPEQLREFEEQMRQMTEMLSQQNSLMAAQLKAQQDYIRSMKGATKASDDAAKADEDQAAASEGLTKLEEAEAKAKQRAIEAQQNYRDSLVSAKGAVIGFSDALLDSQVGFDKYGKALGSAGDAAWSLGKNFGLIGMAAGGAIKGLTMVGELAFKQADALLKVNDALSQSGAANSFTAEEIRQMGRAMGLSSQEMEKFSKQATTLNGGLRVLGTSAADGVKAFSEMNTTTAETRQAFQRLGFDDEARIKATGDYVRLLERSNAGLTSRQLSEANLAKQAKSYAENLLILSDLTGKDVEEVKKQQEVNRATYEWTLQQNKWQQQRLEMEKRGDAEGIARLDKEIAAANKLIDDVGALGDPAKTAAVQMQYLTGAVTKQSSQFAVLGMDLEAQIKAAKDGTYQQGQFSDEYRKNAQAMLDSGGTALAFSEDFRNATGLNRETVGQINQYNKDLSAGVTQQQIAAKKQAEIDANNEGKGKAAEDPAQKARNTLTEAERSARLAVDDLVASMNPLLKGFDATTIAAGLLAAAAVAASIALGKMALSAAMGGKGPTAKPPATPPKKPAAPRARDARGRFVKAPPPKPQSWLSKMTKPLSGFASKAGAVAKGAGRFIPGIGQALAIGGAAYGAYNAASEAEKTLGIEGRKATTGEKFAAGAGGALSALTFGLVSAETAGKGIMSMAERFKKQETEAKKVTGTGLGAQQTQAKEQETARKKHEETVAAQKKNTEATAAGTSATVSSTEAVDKNIEQLDKLRETTEVNSKTEKQALDKFIFNLDQASIGLKSLNNAMTILSQTVSSINFGGGAGGAAPGAPGADMGGELGGMAAQFESGSEGTSAVGHDSTGGTSYGKYQIASNTGTMDLFMKHLQKTNPEAFERLSKAGPAKAGKDGAFAQEWKKLAKEGKLQGSEHEFIKATHYDVGVEKIKDKNLQEMIKGSKALQEVMWSTSVQHGGGGAGSIFNKAYQKGMSEQELIKEIYAQRATRFSSSTPQVRASVQDRFRKEEQLALGLVGRPGQQAGGMMMASGKLEDVLKFTSPSGEMSDFQALNPGMKRAVYNAATEYMKATGNKLQVNSAKRDPEDQQRLYDETVRAGRPGRGPGGMLVARPGRSPHESGNAIDIQQYSDRTAVQILAKHGLQQKYGSKDPVHFELMASDGGIFDGPKKGYDVQLHGTELVAPLMKDSVLMRLAQTPAKMDTMEKMFGDMTGNISKFTNTKDIEKKFSYSTSSNKESTVTTSKKPAEVSLEDISKNNFANFNSMVDKIQDMTKTSLGRMDSNFDKAFANFDLSEDDTDFDFANIEKMFGSMATDVTKSNNITPIDVNQLLASINKDTELAKSPNSLTDRLDPNTMLADVMQKQKDAEQKAMSLLTAKTETISPTAPVATSSPNEKALEMNTQLMEMLSGKLDTMISVLESGNDVSSKILKSSRV